MQHDKKLSSNDAKQQIHMPKMTKAV